MNGFDPKECVKGPRTFHGIVSKFFTPHNLEKLVEKDSAFTLLVGFAAVSHTRVFQDSLPTKNQTRTTFARNLTRDGYDSMSFTDDKGFDSLLVLEPFPMVAVCRLSLTKDELLSLSKHIPHVAIADLEPEQIAYLSPPNDCTVVTSIVLNGPEIGAVGVGSDSDSYASSDELEKEAELLLQGTEFDSLPMNIHWSGGLDCVGEVPRGVEKNLTNKLQFLAPNSLGADPFSSVKLLRSLLDEPQMTSLHLFMAAEILQHSKKDARHHLDKYKEYVRSNLPETKVHPFALLVAARLDDTAAMTLLSTYNHLFPLQSRFLLDKEKATIRGQQQSKDTQIDMSITLLQQWSELKADYPGEVVSRATEELLSLTGLRKVKEEALRMWKTAMQLKRMDDEARKENQAAANYCFLGNPGTVRNCKTLSPECHNMFATLTIVV